MKIAIVLSVALLASGCAYRAGPKAVDRADAATAVAEDDLHKALSGRIAGPPQDCVNEPYLGGNKSFGRGAILFGNSDDQVVYVNRPVAGCPEIDSMRALKTRSTSTRLCRGDIITVFDPVSGMSFGACSLGEFTPYAIRPADSASKRAAE